MSVMVLALVIASNAAAQHIWTWASKPVGLISDSAWMNSTNGVAIDNNDNRIIVGNFYDSASFGATKLHSYNRVDMYIAKLNSTGVFQWAKHIGGWDVSETALDVDTDPSGSAYMAGYFSDSLDFDGTIVKEAGSTLVAVAKYNSSGTVQWARRAAGFQTGLWGGVAYSPTGHLYVGCGLSLTKYNASNGDSVWTWQLPLGVTTSFQIDDIAVDKSGDYIYITGMFALNAQIGTTHLTTPNINDKDIFVAKFDKNGNAIWAKRAGGTTTTFDQGFGVDVDGSGNVYVTGTYSDYAYFDADTVYSNFSGHAFFVAKYDPNGNVEWVKGASSTFAGTTSDGLDVRVVENDDAVLVAAHYVQNMSFDGATYNLLLGIEPIVFKLDAITGAVDWALRTDTNWITTRLTSMDVNRTTSTLSVSGWHIDDAKFGLYHLNSPLNNYDGFVATANTDSPTPIKEKPSDVLPASLSLLQNYPNPFNPSTTIEYAVPVRSQVTVTIFNVLGEQVKTLVNEVQSAGTYTVEWDGLNAAGKKAATGVYLYRIQAGDVSETKKMLLVK
jgi:hypothetical protein